MWISSQGFLSPRDMAGGFYLGKRYKGKSKKVATMTIIITYPGKPRSISVGINPHLLMGGVSKNLWVFKKLP